MIVTKTRLFSFRTGIGFLLVSIFALAGCSESGTGQVPPPSQGTSSAGATNAPTTGNGKTETADPTLTAEATAGTNNSATSDPTATKESAPASTPVPPPTPGSINETVESRPAETKDPVRIKETATFDQEVSAEITAIKKIDDPSAGMPNEVAGPGLAITVMLTNGTSNSVPLDSVVVEMLDSAEVPGGRMTGDPYDPLSGSLAVGETASGTYVYTVPKDRRDPISVVVTFTADEPMVLFQGPVE